MSEFQFGVLTLAVVGPFVLAAMISDIRARRLPNVLTVAIAALSLLLHLIHGGWAGLGWAALGLVVGFALLLPFYVVRMFPAGDLKLAGALGAMMGYPHVWYGIAAGVVLAGVYSLIVMLKQPAEVTKQRWSLVMAKMIAMKTTTDFASVESLEASQKKLAYGVFLGIGALGTIIYQLIDLRWAG